MKETLLTRNAKNAGNQRNSPFGALLYLYPVGDQTTGLVDFSHATAGKSF
jgi:hypothetical protein